MDHSPTLALTLDLIRRPSITPEDAGCQTLMCTRLEAMGFEVTPLQSEDVSNFWATRGKGGPLLVFAGHTDVVPPGPAEAWSSPAFEPQIRDEYLYGRGAADMKGSLAAMLVATENFIAQDADHSGQLGFLITSDEEGPAVNGTCKVVDYLQAQEEKIDYCVVGEPSSVSTLGDMVKVGRRGSLGAILKIKGVQGHIAYPQLARNPIHQAFLPLQALVTETWDQGNEYFPATSFQISNIHGGTGAGNVIPGEMEVQFNFRYSTELNAAVIRQRVKQILQEAGLEYDIDWTEYGTPFLTQQGVLIDAVQQAVNSVTGTTPELSTAGGTSDGRFIAPTGAEVVELGPCNESIHKVDECVRVEDLDLLTTMYQRIIERILR